MAVDRSQFVGLVVEDEWLLRLDMAEELRRAGWTVLEASTGEGALALIESGRRIDFLVTDIRLPGEADGWTVAEGCRRLYPRLPVIYVSANPIAETRRVPGSLFYPKPCDMDMLLAGCDSLCLP